MAALRWARRKLYKLYIAEPEHAHAPTAHTKTQQQDPSSARRSWVVKRARDIGVPIVSLDRDGQRLLDKLSNGRPHNVSHKKLNLPLYVLLPPPLLFVPNGRVSHSWDRTRRLSGNDNVLFHPIPPIVYFTKCTILFFRDSY